MTNNRDKTNGWQTGKIESMERTCRETRLTFAGALNGLATKVDNLQATILKTNNDWFDQLSAVKDEVAEMRGRRKGISAVRAVIITLVLAPVATAAANALIKLLPIGD